MANAMVPLWAAVPGWVPGLLAGVLLVAGVLLIGLVLIQRGKGGGLAGAFGGSGGSSAFGSRAGDTFTKVTIYVAAVWILLIMFLIKMVQPITPLPTRGGGVEQRDPAPPRDDG